MLSGAGPGPDGSARNDPAIALCARLHSTRPAHCPAGSAFIATNRLIGAHSLFSAASRAEASGTASIHDAIHPGIVSSLRYPATVPEGGCASLLLSAPTGSDRNRGAVSRRSSGAFAKVPPFEDRTRREGLRSSELRLPVAG